MPPDSAARYAAFFGRASDLVSDLRAVEHVPFACELLAAVPAAAGDVALRGGVVHALWDPANWPHGRAGVDRVRHLGRVHGFTVIRGMCESAYKAAHNQSPAPDARFDDGQALRVALQLFTHAETCCMTQDQVADLFQRTQHRVRSARGQGHADRLPPRVRAPAAARCLFTGAVWFKGGTWLQRIRLHAVDLQSANHALRAEFGPDLVWSIAAESQPARGN